MIFHPRKGQTVRVNYRNKTMTCQGIIGEVVSASNGPGPRNVKIKVQLWPGKDEYFYEIIPRGNLVAIAKER
jgi:hypothetical protein